MAEMGIKAYKDDTACLSCIFYESSMCRPYRRFLNSFMNEHHDDIDEQTISVCEDYTDVEAGQKQGIL